VQRCGGSSRALAFAYQGLSCHRPAAADAWRLVTGRCFERHRTSHRPKIVLCARKAPTRKVLFPGTRMLAIVASCKHSVRHRRELGAFGEGGEEEAQPFGQADRFRPAASSGGLPQMLGHTNTGMRHVTVVGQSSSTFLGLVMPGTSAVVHDRKREWAAVSSSKQAVRPLAASARWLVGRAKWSTGQHCQLQQACSIRLPQRSGYLGSNCIGSHCSQRPAREASRSSSVACALHSAAGHYSHTRSIWPIHRSAQ